MRTVASLRSSFFANRLRAALWIAVVAVAIALIVAVLVGFGTHHDKQTTSRRTVVGAYIIRVGRIQLLMSSQIKAVDRRYKLFAKDPEHLAQRAGTYTKSRDELAKLRDRLAAVKPPVEARRLHALILQLADANVAVAGDVAELASYLPRMAKAQAPLRSAVVTLRGQVKEAKTATAQSTAFAAYAAAASGVATDVAKVRAPSFFRRARDLQVRQLRRLASIATQISDALAHKHLAEAQSLVAKLSQTEVQVSVARAQRQGALAYNAKLKQISRIAKQIERERRRLERRVPA